jgi:hypothetical protein
MQRYCWLYNDYKLSGGMLVDIPVTETRVKKTGQTLYACQSCGFEHTPEDLDIPDFADEFKDKDLSDIHEGGAENAPATKRVPP